MDIRKEGGYHMTPILQVDNLSKSYKNTKVVNRFQLSMEKGHIHGLIGPNGAGKTTIMKMLAGLTTADEGKMAFLASATTWMNSETASVL